MAAYGGVAALQPFPHFGRVYAACGGIFVVMAPAWGALIEGFGPERWDTLDASVASLGASIMDTAPRG